MTQTSPVQTATVRGRSMQVRPLNELQIMLIAREARILTKDGVSGEKKLDAVATMLDVLETMIISDEDKEFVRELTIKGDISLSDIMGLVPQMFNVDTEEKPRVRRGRPRKSVS